MMLRFVNAHRLASVALLAAVVLVVVTMMGLVGGRPPDESAVASATDQTAAPPASATSPDSEPGPGSTVPVSEPAPVDDPSRLTMPEDPSGSRHDRSEAGALQSAIDFAGTVQQRLLYLTDDAAHGLLASWSHDTAHPDRLDADVDALSTLRSTLTAGGGTVWWSVTPIASNVAAFDSERARVSVWVTQIVGSDVDPTLGGEAVAPTVDFRTTTVDLVWDDAAGWSVWSTASTPGPVPMMATTSTMSSPTEFMDSLGSFTLTKEHS